MRTALHQAHRDRGARLGEFAGWEMPLSYAGPRVEHLAVRRHAGLFDVSHMGQIEVSGPGARELLARTLTNDLGAIGPGRGQYTLMLADDGGVIDDLIAFALADRYLLVVNAANREAALARLTEDLPGGAPPEGAVRVADRTLEVAMLALQGPAFEDVLAPLAATPSPTLLEYFDVTEDVLAGVPALVARTGYTGEPGVEIMCPWESAPALWDALLGVDAPLEPAGLVARDTLRLEMGYPLYGQELTRARTPIEAGLRWACDLEGGVFAGVERLRREASEGTPERLTAFELAEPGIPRPGQAVVHEGRPVGTVTSGTLSPMLGVGIGLAYVESALATPDVPIAVDVRGKLKSARTARRPLVGASPRST
jgi:glycine cleavage system T protein (aminomethyltransferase)